MIVEERMRTFINSLDPGEPAWLDEIRSSALQDNVPIIRMEMGSLLRFLLTLRRPSSILEVGTAVGYSALFMSEYMPENCHITTIEKYEKRNRHGKGMEDFMVKSGFLVMCPISVVRIY